MLEWKPAVCSPPIRPRRRSTTASLSAMRRTTMSAALGTKTATLAVHATARPTRLPFRDPNPHWSGYYTYASEIQEYFLHLYERHDLVPFVVLNTAALSATSNDSEAGDRSSCGTRPKLHRRSRVKPTGKRTRQPYIQQLPVAIDRPRRRSNAGPT